MRLSSPEGEEEENAERGDGDALSMCKSEEGTPTTTSRGEDTGPSFQEPKKRPSETEQGEEAPESEIKLKGSETFATRSSPATFQE
ncbi:hypothetical protein NDU88_010253 [Pleurodeles waltl]|uniref:Uncharacterized protein n=1 Tax=Pleurodeles waltl TaxID=8319 RepID=A0AAV7RYG6_PLEWA|nr:hypothetical protein NDU88_010253 [Pleurodeles waltl]